MTGTETSNGRVAWVNGALVPEAEASVSIRDMGLVYGDSVFDTARTFNGRVFMLEEHVDRLFRSLAYARIDPGLDRQGYIDATHQVIEANLPVLRDGEDYWVTIRVSGGVQSFDGEPPATAGPTILIDCIPLPLRARAPFFANGIDARTTTRQRIAPEALSPNTKTNNYLNMVLAQKEVSAEHPGTWALMPDRNGNIAEGAGCNFFAVKDGTVLTPSTEFILEGVSRQVVIDICAELGLPLEERDLPLDLALDADEAFFTSTSLCACPVASLDGQRYEGAIPGPVTERIMAAFAEKVGMDFVAQYRRFLTNAPASTGL